MKHISVMLILQFIISFSTSSIFAVSPKKYPVMTPSNH